MAARQNRQTGQDVTADTVAPDGDKPRNPEATPNEPLRASVPAEAEPAEAQEKAVTDEDKRKRALEILLAGRSVDDVLENRAAAPTTPRRVQYDENQEPDDFGGDVRAVVLFHHWRQVIDGVNRVARRGRVIATTEEEAARGEKLGGLERI